MCTMWLSCPTSRGTHVPSDCLTATLCHLTERENSTFCVWSGIGYECILPDLIVNRSTFLLAGELIISPGEPIICVCQMTASKAGYNRGLEFGAISGKNDYKIICSASF